MGKSSVCRSTMARPLAAVEHSIPIYMHWAVQISLGVQESGLLFEQHQYSFLLWLETARIGRAGELGISDGPFGRYRPQFRSVIT